MVWLCKLGIAQGWVVIYRGQARFDGHKDDFHAVWLATGITAG
jgi:hypothetical protein